MLCAHFDEFDPNRFASVQRLYTNIAKYTYFQIYILYHGQTPFHAYTPSRCRAVLFGHHNRTGGGCFLPRWISRRVGCLAAAIRCSRGASDGQAAEGILYSLPTNARAGPSRPGPCVPASPPARGRSERSTQPAVALFGSRFGGGPRPVSARVAVRLSRPGRPGIRPGPTERPPCAASRLRPDAAGRGVWCRRVGLRALTIRRRRAVRLRQSVAPGAAVRRPRALCAVEHARRVSPHQNERGEVTREVSRAAREECGASTRRAERARVAGPRSASGPGTGWPSAPRPARNQRGGSCRPGPSGGGLGGRARLLGSGGAGRAPIGRRARRGSGTGQPAWRDRRSIRGQSLPSGQLTGSTKALGQAATALRPGSPLARGDDAGCSGSSAGGFRQSVRAGSGRARSGRAVSGRA